MSTQLNQSFMFENEQELIGTLMDMSNGYVSKGRKSPLSLHGARSTPTGLAHHINTRSTIH